MGDEGSGEDEPLDKGRPVASSMTHDMRSMTTSSSTRRNAAANRSWSSGAMIVSKNSVNSVERRDVVTAGDGPPQIEEQTARQRRSGDERLAAEHELERLADTFGSRRVEILEGTHDAVPAYA